MLLPRGASRARAPGNPFPQEASLGDFSLEQGQAGAIPCGQAGLRAALVGWQGQQAAVSPEWDSPQGLLLHASLPSTGGHQGTQWGGRRRLAWGPASTPGGGGPPLGPRWGSQTAGGAGEPGHHFCSQTPTLVPGPFPALPQREERGGGEGRWLTRQCQDMEKSPAHRQAGRRQTGNPPSTLFKPSQTATEKSHHRARRHADPRHRHSLGWWATQPAPAGTSHVPLLTLRAHSTRAGMGRGS